MTQPDIPDVIRYEQHPDRVDAVVLHPDGDETLGRGNTADDARAKADTARRNGKPTKPKPKQPKPKQP